MAKSKHSTTTEPIEQLVSESIPTMLAYWDANVICRYANAAYLAWFNVTRDELIGKMTMEQLLGTRYGLTRPYVEGALQGAPQHFDRAILLPGNEGVCYAHVSFLPHVEDGTVQGFMAHATDITHVMLLQQELESSSNTIKAQNKSLMAFANIVSHNLMSYAGNLKSMLGLYEHAPDAAGKNEIFDYLKEISEGFKTTVDNLVEVVRAHNLSTVPMQEVGLHEYVNKVTDILRPQISTTFATVQNYVNPVRVIDANPAYVESIIMNLISNAIKYRHPGRHPLIEVSTYVVGPETILSVKDNGIGIDLDTHRKELYAMYKTFHGNEDATGIGLFITKYQVDAMGGHIGVESTPNEGTEFRVYFKTKQG